MTQPKDYKGSKFNKLTMISDMGTSSTGRGRLWMCVCDCGNDLIWPGREVAAGRKRSCGKCARTLTEKRGGYRARSAEDSKARSILKRTGRKALREGIQFALSTKDIHELDLRKCFLCSSELRVTSLQLEFVNPAEGYTVGNVAAICPLCRRRMLSDNILEFLTYIQSVNNSLK